MGRFRLLLPLVVAGALVGCRSVTEVCAGVGAPTALVTVTDSVTGAPLAALARVVLRGGGRVDSTAAPSGPGDSTLAVGNGWPGTYLVEVSVAGYRPWTRDGVEVRDGCPAIRTARVHARMQR